MIVDGVRYRLVQTRYKNILNIERKAWIGWRYVSCCSLYPNRTPEQALRDELALDVGKIYE